jgi:hypothetical protein
MNGVINWGDFTPGSNGSNGDRPEFLWLKSGNTYTVRPVAKPVIFYKYFYKNGDELRTAICQDPSTCKVAQAHKDDDKLETPGERFSILVIDRADQKLKIMEFPKGVFLSIKEWWTNTQQNPGGNNGVDWAIAKSGQGKTGTKYKTTALLPAPFTAEEQQMILAVIKDAEGNQSNYLENIYKAHSTEVIEQKLFGPSTKGQGQGQPAQVAQAAPAPVTAPATQAAPIAQAQPAATGATDIDW